MKRIDAYLTVWGSANTREMASITPQRRSFRIKSLKPLTRTRFRRMGDKTLRWCGTLFPTNGEAQEAGMSLAEWEEFVFSACHLQAKDPIAHWKKVSTDQARLAW